MMLHGTHSAAQATARASRPSAASTSAPAAPAMHGRDAWRLAKQRASLVSLPVAFIAAFVPLRVDSCVEFVAVVKERMQKHAMFLIERDRTSERKKCFI